MTDHANEIRDVLMWAQAYAPDRLAHRLIDAEESLRELRAGQAAEVDEWVRARNVWMHRTERAESERDDAKRLLEQARAEVETLRQENERLRKDVAERMAVNVGLIRENDALKKKLATGALAAAQEPPAKGDDRDE